MYDAVEIDFVIRQKHLSDAGYNVLIGLCRMGKGMVHRIQGGGHELTAFDVVREATTEFAAAGVRVADSIADVCKGNEVVLTMLVEDSAVIDVVLRRRHA